MPPSIPTSLNFGQEDKPPAFYSWPKNVLRYDHDDVEHSKQRKHSDRSPRSCTPFRRPFVLRPLNSGC
jgi:hypothetical protein